MPTATPTKTVDTAKSTFQVPGIAYLDGRDVEAKPPLTIMAINVWDGVPRTKVLCQLQHGDQVDLLEAQYHTPESRWYFLIRKGDCRGWLPESFLSDKKHKPVGDKL